MAGFSLTEPTKNGLPCPRLSNLALASLIPDLDLKLVELSVPPVASYRPSRYSTRGGLQYLLATRWSVGNLVGFEPGWGARVYTRA